MQVTGGDEPRNEVDDAIGFGVSEVELASADNGAGRALFWGYGVFQRCLRVVLVVLGDLGQGCGEVVFAG